MKYVDALLIVALLAAAACTEDPTGPSAPPHARVVALAAGQFHTCALDEEGAVYCWGSPAQVGTARGGGETAPARVALPGPATAIDAGATATCATVGDSRWCWGELAGIGYAITPAPDTALPAGGETAFGRVGTDPPYRCALDAEGSAWCLGGNRMGQVGNDAGTFTVDAALPVLGGHRWLSVAASVWTSCGVTADNALYCWGLIADAKAVAAPEPMISDPYWRDLAWKDVMLGDHFACGLAGLGSDETQVVCLGLAGDGTIGGQPFHGLTNPGRASRLAVGWHHGCLVDRGSLRCWGLNDHGQLGTGDRDSRTEATTVSGRHDWIEVAAGDRHTCGLSGDGTVYCWGAKDRTQLATSGFFDHLDPVRVYFPVPDST